MHMLCETMLIAGYEPGLHGIGSDRDGLVSEVARTTKRISRVLRRSWRGSYTGKYL
jgi:hypothetical protein